MTDDWCLSSTDKEPVREPKRRQSAAQMISRRASEGVRFAMQKVGRQKSSAMEDSKLEDAKMEVPQLFLSLLSEF
jgi:hypothetical protein